jgi:hypothetical protein
MEIDTFLPIAAGQFCLLSNWLTAGILHFFFFPEVLLYPLRIAKRLSKAFEHFPVAFLYPYSSARQLFNSL